jgi:hypothetical protein
MVEMTRILSVIAFLLCMTHAAFAQSEPCWDVVSPTQSAQPFTPILINKCDGKTWILAKESFPDKQGKPTGVYTYRWTPVMHEDGEAHLSVPHLGGAQ